MDFPKIINNYGAKSEKHDAELSFPKIIHQIWLQGKNNIPSKHNTNIQSIRELNPDYEHILWDEVSILQFIHTNEVWTKTYYGLKYLHQKVDYARYIILWLMGGLYVDIDVKGIKSFDDLLERHKKYDLIVSCINTNEMNSMIQCQHKRCLNNGIIIAKPNVEVINKIIEYVNENNSCNDIIPKVLCINTTTGPLAFTKVIMNYIKDNVNNNILLLQPEYLEPCTLGICESTPNTIIEHQHDGSWVPEWQYNLIKMYLQHTTSFVVVLTIFLLLIILLMVYFVYQKYRK